MKIRILINNICTPYGNFKSGDIISILDNKTAMGLITSGNAENITETVPSIAEIVEHVVEPVVESKMPDKIQTFEQIMEKLKKKPIGTFIK